MPSEYSAERDATRLVTTQALALGWDRDAASASWDWPQFRRMLPGDVELALSYLPGQDWIGLSMLTAEQEGNLRIVFGERLSDLLALIGRWQDSLRDEASWMAFIEDALALPTRVLACHGDDGDDQTELYPLGKAASENGDLGAVGRGRAAGGRTSTGREAH